MPQELSISIKGRKQGQFKSDGREAGIIARALSYEVKMPRDPATGQASGKRQHSPVTITKEWGPSSPQLFQALVTNEVLESVVIELSRTGQDGKKTVVHTITLNNANVLSWRSYRDGSIAAHDGVSELEDVAFSFEKIEIQHNPTKTIAKDDAGPKP